MNKEVTIDIENPKSNDAISREDALMALTGEWTEPTDELIHRFIKRIKNLPSVKPQLCEDVISRREAIKKFTYNYKGQRIPDYDYDNWPVQIDIKTVKEMLRELPSVKPQTGHWIEHPEIETSTPEYLMFYECSECGDKQCFCKSDIHKKHFCNNCGARMEVEQHG